MLNLIASATLHLAVVAPIDEPPRQPIPVICLALAPKLVEHVAEGVITRKQAGDIFTECLKRFQGQGVQF